MLFGIASTFFPYSEFASTFLVQYGITSVCIMSKLISFSSLANFSKNCSIFLFSSSYLAAGISIFISLSANSNVLFLDCRASNFLSVLWRNHPKQTGTSALIIVARELWSNSHYCGNSSSKVLIKVTLSGIETNNNSHEGEPREYNTEHFLHLRVAVKI